MEIKEITNKDEWEGFLAARSEKTFLQSWNWGDFNMEMGFKIWRLGVYHQNRLLGVCLIHKVVAKRGIFLSMPHGPILADELFSHDKKEALELILLHISDVAKAEKASFIRITPLFLNNPENKNLFLNLGFRTAPMHASAYEATWKLDITLPTDELLANMRKTTRYLIKKASENNDISIEINYSEEGITIYQKLNKEVSKRQKFIPFSDKFIENEFKSFKEGKEIIFLFGKYKGEIVAGAIIVFWSGIAFYHQAASLNKHAKLSVPYLLQWEAIKEAKNRGCKVYDFWGFTDPQKYPRHPWAGPTLFKMGFGGYKTEYIKTQDLVLSKKYWINYIIENIRKYKRKL